MSAVMTRAPPTVTVPWLTRTFSDWPLRVLTECSFTTFAAVSLPLSHVVEQDRAQLVAVVRQRRQRRLRHLRERGVGGREHGERTLALERAGQTGLLGELEERLELACGGGGSDDVALAVRRRAGHRSHRRHRNSGDRRERDVALDH